jgi:hypothetical protein
MEKAAELPPHNSFSFPPVDFEQPEIIAEQAAPIPTEPEVPAEVDTTETPESKTKPTKEIPVYPLDTAAKGTLRASSRFPNNMFRRRGGGGGSWRYGNGSCSNCAPGISESAPASQSRGCQNCGSHGQQKDSSKSDHTSQH